MNNCAIAYVKMKLTYPNWLGITAEYPALILGKANAENTQKYLLYYLNTTKCINHHHYHHYI